MNTKAIDVGEVLLETLDRISQLETSGEMSPEDAQASRDLANKEYRELSKYMQNRKRSLSANFMEDEEEIEAITPFGASLIEAINATFEVPEEGIVAVADASELDPAYVIAVIAGEDLPTEDLIIGAATALDLDDDELELLIVAAEKTLAMTEGEEEMEVGDEDGDYEEVMDADYSAAFKALELKNQELEARFSQAQAEREINNVLIQQQLRAQEGVDSGWLPPVVMNSVFGSFHATDDDRVATFSKSCDQSQVDADTELYAREKILAAFQSIGSFVDFSRLGDEDVSSSYDPEEDIVRQSGAAYARKLLQNRRTRAGVHTN